MEDQFYLEPVPLTKKETALRKKLEEKFFHTVRQAYIDIGELLTEINAKRLYKSTHQTFGEYSNEVLDMAKSRAYQYIDAAGVVRNLSTNGGQNISQLPEITVPQNEKQARALVGLTPEEQKTVWFEAVETADGRITAAHIRKTVRELGLAKITKKTNEAKETRKYDGTRMSDEFKEGFNGFLAAIQTELTSNWKTTDRLSVVKHLDAMRNTISENGNHKVPDRGFTLEASNFEKLEAAGFTLYRTVKKNNLIERHDPDVGWIVVETYEDSQAMAAAFEEVLKTETNLRG